MLPSLPSHIYLWLMGNGTCYLLIMGEISSTKSVIFKFHFFLFKTYFCIILGLWAIVNNAGIGYPGPIEWQPVEEMKKTLEVNLWGMVNITKAFLPLLKRTKGRVVNVASSSGRLSAPFAAAYCISKFGVEAFSDALRNEMKHFGVTVHIIEPGIFKTAITDAEKNIKYLQRLWENLDGDTKECYGEEFYEQGMGKV